MRVVVVWIQETLKKVALVIQFEEMASASDASSDVCAVEISDESSSSSTTTKKKDISTNGAHHSSDNGNGDNHEDKSESLLLEQVFTFIKLYIFWI